MTYHNDDAELAILGCCMHDPAAVARAGRTLDVTDFFRESHRRIWETLLRLRRSQMTIDAVTVVDDLDSRGMLKRVGGAQFVATLGNHVVSWRGVDDYVRIVRDNAQKRALRAASIDATTALDSGEEAHTVLSALAQAVRSFKDSAPRRYTEEALEYMEATQAGEVGLSLENTAPWYHALAGPIQEGAFYILAAMSGHGKTTVMSNIVSSARKADDRVRCLWFSCEMPRKFQLFRIMSAHFDIRESYFLDVRQVPAEHSDRFWADAMKMVEFEEWLTLRRMAPLDAHRIAMEIEAECAEHPDAKVIAVVDYIQRAECGQRSDRENVAGASRILADAALNSGASVFALSQFTENERRNVEAGIPLPTAQQLRTSKDIEHDAVEVLIYHRPWMDRRCVLAMPKSRYPLRKPGIIHLEGDDRGAWIRAQDGSCGDIGSYLRRVTV